MSWFQNRINSALKLTASRGLDNISDLLISIGADPNNSENKVSALDIAVKNDDLDLAEAVLRNDADGKCRCTAETIISSLSNLQSKEMLVSLIGKLVDKYPNDINKAIHKLREMLNVSTSDTAKEYLRETEASLISFLQLKYKPVLQKRLNHQPILKKVDEKKERELPHKQLTHDAPVKEFLSKIQKNQKQGPGPQKGLD